MRIHELKYSNTNTYLIEGDKGRLLFDTGWAGSLSAFCSSVGALDVSVQSIDYVLISHFHPDHMGIAQEIADLGPAIVVMDIQRDYIHTSDFVFAKENNPSFKPVKDDDVKLLKIADSRAFLENIGIAGEIIHTPGHSDDSISLRLDSGELFVGDLNPLYELELHTGTQIEETWMRLLALNPKTIYYGHAKKTDLENGVPKADADTGVEINANDLHSLVSKIIRSIDKGVSIDCIQKKTGADKTFIEDVTRMYLTHQNVGVQGILDRIEIKGK